MENKQYFKALQCLDKVLEIDSYDAEAISQKQNCIKMKDTIVYTIF